MRHTMFLLFVLTVLTGFSSSIAHAEVRLPALISDNMVLQADAEARVWGWADPGEEVTVKVAEQTVLATADAKGQWELHLAPMPRSDDSVEMVVTGNAGGEAIKVGNILVGEVWVCAGQSNMWWPVSRTTDANAEIAAADHPTLRLFTVPVRAAVEPVTDVGHEKVQTVPEVPQPEIVGRWIECSPDVIGDFSGTAYYFGRDLQRSLNAPVGIVSMAVGGTVVTAWTSRTGLSAVESGRVGLAYWDDYAVNQYPGKLAAWQTANALPETDGDAASTQHEPPIDPELYINRTAALYNGMVAPVTPYTIRGVTWYQGESNASSPSTYGKLLPAMIHDWRAAWDVGPFPFVIVQLPNLDTSHYSSLGKPGDWPIIREAQARAAEMDNAGLTVTIDIGKSDDAHPPNKQEVAKRMVLTAEALAYGRDAGYAGPTFASMNVEGHEARLTFDHVEGGLVTKGDESEQLRGFEVAGDDYRYFAADARIDGQSVMVGSEQVAQPVAARYAWTDNPEGTLYNCAGLPAAPFRTDDTASLDDSQAKSGSFDTAAIGFWNKVDAPIGWESSDPARTYTTATRFIILSPDVTVASNTGLRARPRTRYELRADLGGGEGTTAICHLLAVEKPDGTGDRVVLATLEQDGTGEYELTPQTATSEPVKDNARDFYLRLELTSRGGGAGYFDNLAAAPAPGE